MPGRLRSSFRSGNLAEHLGLLLLKGIAAVADVARPEDVGLDAIATLLRRDKDGNSYAEASFLVQLKADSQKRIEYSDHELQWFLRQTQPLFIGLVSLTESKISLYPTLFVNHAVLATDPKKVTINFGHSKLRPFLRGQKWGPWQLDPNDHEAATVWLGAPLLQWTLGDLADHGWARRAYAILKLFLAIAQRELELLSFSQSSVLDWSTNDAASITSQPFGLVKGPVDQAQLAAHCTPCLHAIMSKALSMPAGSREPLLLSLIKLAAALRDNGVEVDPRNLFEKFFAAVNKTKHKDEADSKM